MQNDVDRQFSEVESNLKDNVADLANLLQTETDVKPQVPPRPQIPDKKVNAESTSITLQNKEVELQKYKQEKEAELQKYKQEKAAELQKYKREKEAELQKLKQEKEELLKLKYEMNNELEKKNEVIKKKHQEIETLQRNTNKRDINSEKHEDIYNNFYKAYNLVEHHLPNRLEMDKVKVLKLFCDIYQKSFVQCREAIHNTFMESLVSLTELTVEENNSGRTNWDRREELESVQRAYQCLLQHCSPKLDAVDRSLIAKNVMASLQFDDKIFPILEKQTLKAVNICWKMQMLSPPMFLCQPNVFTDNWHTVHGGTWCDKENELVYYRPVLMYTAGGTVAHKGFVGNEVALPERTIEIMAVKEDISIEEQESSPSINPAPLIQPHNSPPRVQRKSESICIIL